MLGHILRGAEDCPAYLAILFAINADKSLSGRLGRPSMNLLDIVRKDLKCRSIDNALKTIDDFENLRFLALDRAEWKRFEQCRL